MAAAIGSTEVNTPAKCAGTCRMPFIHSQNEKMLADSAYQTTRPQTDAGTLDASNVSSGTRPSGSISRHCPESLSAQPRIYQAHGFLEMNFASIFKSSLNKAHPAIF